MQNLLNGSDIVGKLVYKADDSQPGCRNGCLPLAGYLKVQRVQRAFPIVRHRSPPLLEVTNQNDRVVT